ncbi:MAG: energy-coupling factor transporter transmembrane component T family protein [Candidatus Dormibacteraceae bacterium]
MTGQIPALNARAVAAWAGAAILVALQSDNPIYRGMVLAAALAFVSRRRRPGARMRGLLAPLAGAVAITVILNSLLSHNGDDVLWDLPGWLPGIGGTVTLEAVSFGLTIAAGLAAAVLAASALTLTVEVHDLIDALPSALAQVAAAVGGALNLVPGIGRGLTAVREAQRMRGWRPRGPRSWSQVLVPAMLTSVESSVQLAESMEARGFGSGPRTRYRPGAWRRIDVAVTAGAGLAAFLFLAGRHLGFAGDWYPFPTLSMPPADPVALVACLLLFVPAVRWPR